MKIHALTLTHNGIDHLKLMIPSLFRAALKTRCKIILYIRDNGSTDSTKDLIDSYLLTMPQEEREFIENYIIKKDDTTNLNYSSIGSIYNKFYKGGNQIRKIGNRIFTG